MISLKTVLANAHDKPRSDFAVTVEDGVDRPLRCPSTKPGDLGARSDKHTLRAIAPALRQALRSLGPIQHHRA